LPEETIVRNRSPLSPAWMAAPACPLAAAKATEAASALSFDFIVLLLQK